MQLDAAGHCFPECLKKCQRSIKLQTGQKDAFTSRPLQCTLFFGAKVLLSISVFISSLYNPECFSPGLIDKRRLYKTCFRDYSDWSTIPLQSSTEAVLVLTVLL